MTTPEKKAIIREWERDRKKLQRDKKRVRKYSPRSTRKDPEAKKE
jgi:hypothetical protein